MVMDMPVMPMLLLLMLLVLVMVLLCSGRVEHDQGPLGRHIVRRCLRAARQAPSHRCSRGRIAKRQKSPCAVPILAVSDSCRPVLPRVPP